MAALGLCALGPDRAVADVPLKALQGFSIEAEYWVGEHYLLLRGNERKNITDSFRYTLAIFVSDKGQIFYRRAFFDQTSGYKKPVWVFEQRRGRKDEALTYDLRSGFTFLNIPADDNRNSTFLEIVNFAISGSGSSMSCNVSLRWALKQGEKEYRAVNRDFTKIIDRRAIQSSTCKVFKGNALATKR